MNQFRNIDRPSAPQTVSIEFIRAQAPDEYPDLSFLEQSYSDVENDAERENMQKADEARLAAYNRGDWYMRGLFVEARISVPIGGGSFALYTLRSPGLWGVESDCGASYENEVWQEEEHALRAALKEMGAAFAKLPD